MNGFKGDQGLRGFGLQDSIEIGERKFKIHTGCDPERKRVLTEVFEGGQYVFHDVKHYSVRSRPTESINETYLKSVTSDLHQKIIDDLKVLFLVQEKVRMQSDPLPIYRLGKIFYSYNFIDEAIENFERVIKLDPDFVRAYKRLGLSYFRKNDYRKAEEICLQVIDRYQNFPDLYDCMGVIYTQVGEYQKAKDAFQKALEVKEDFPEANLNLGIVLFLSTLADSPPDEEVVIPVRIFRMLDRLRKESLYQGEYWQETYREVVETLESGEREEIRKALLELQLKLATRDDPVGTTMDFFFLKFMYGGRGLRHEEMEYYEQVIRSEENQHQGYADYWNELATLHLIQCRDYFLKAMDNFENALNINPKYEEVKRTLELMKHSKKGFLILLRAILK